MQIGCRASGSDMKYGGLLLLCFGLHVLAVPVEKCHDACPKTDPDALNVHLVAHSHDDVGWLKTVDQYYYGSNNSIQYAGVQYIIDSVVMALRQNPERKFIQVESAFLRKWWREQTAEKRQQFLDLVRRGQLEIVGGAWSMNDEAAANYQSIIDQFTFGLRLVDELLGECSRPKVGWQIDPFGHTREMASIFAQMGFDGLFFARLDWRDKSARLASRTGEMLWRGSASLGNESLLFTHVMYNHYSPPPGFYFDVLSRDDPLIPDPESPEYNLRNKAKTFASYVDIQSKNYVTNNIMITMGNDFTYMDALYNFKNLDILVEVFKNNVYNDSTGRRIKVIYSTPGCYLKAVNEYANGNRISFKVKTDDFIPYASDYNSYWSGYYSSRPTQKRFERQGNNLLQVTKQLTSFYGSNFTSLDKNLDELRAAMGVMQHHDAITGTEKQHVAHDYARILTKAVNRTHTNINIVIPKLLNKKPGQKSYLKFETCLLANISYCQVSTKNRFVVAIHNPLSRVVSHYVRLPVDSDKFSIVGPRGEEVKWQITPAIQNFGRLVPNLRSSRFDLVFLAKDLPPLGTKLYYVVNEAPGTHPDDITPSESFVLGDNEDISAQFNPNTGFIHSATIKGLNLPVRQELMYYFGAQGNNLVFKNRSSGAYIFRPDPKNPVAISFSDNIVRNTTVYKGELVDEAHQIFNEWNRQIIRVYKEENHIEFDWLVGPIDIKHNQSKEIISRFYTNLNHESFFTDSNGREILTRRNNYRSTYNYSNEEPVAGNYYPITSGISIRDRLKAVELAVLTDRSQGGASLESGQIELMVHRRLLKDDAFGVEEALNETEFGRGLIARGQHYLTFGSSVSAGPSGYTRRKQREIAQRKLLSPWVFVADATSQQNSLQNIEEHFNFEFAGLRKPLPDDVQILTLEPWSDDNLLLRLEHILEAQEEGAKNVTIDLKGLFTSFEVLSLEETVLGANQLIVEKDRLKWNAGKYLSGQNDSDDAPRGVSNNQDELEMLQITLSPMQIRTFIAKVKFN